MPQSLSGVRVLELARYQAGPRGGMILSDLGAEVIKIERLGGEETRKNPPVVRGQSIYFTVYNRGKKFLCLDMRTDEGKQIFTDLVKQSDIVLENFRPGTMAAMGFSYDQLKAINAKIILISVSGFGQYGPYTDRPAFDPLGQAMSGLMSLTGSLSANRLASRPPSSIVTPRCTPPSARSPPCATATAPARAKWSTFACSTPPSRWWKSPPPITCNRRGRRRGRPSPLQNHRRPRRHFRHQPGHGHPPDDPGHRRGDGRHARSTPPPPTTAAAHSMNGAPPERPTTSSRRCWKGRRPRRPGENHPSGRQRSPYVGARDDGETRRPVAGEIYAPGVTIKMSATPGRVGPVPTPGQHTDELLSRILNFDAAKLDALRQAKVIG